MLGAATAAGLPVPRRAAAAGCEPFEIGCSVQRQGFQVARLTLSFQPAGAKARVRAEVESTGPVGWITSYEGQWETVAAVAPEGTPTPRRFRSTYATRRYSRRVEIDYRKPAGEIAQLRVWKRDDLQKNTIPSDLWQDTIDPLSWILAVRTWAAADAPARTFRLFDGRRRFDLEARRQGQDRVRIAGRDWPVMRIRMAMVPLAGYDRDDAIIEWLDGGDDRWLELLLSDDAQRVPLSLRTVGGSYDYAVIATAVARGALAC
jgi:Protein of unknown function (DUF3108)